VKAAAAGAVTLGATVMLVALVATPGQWWRGYVSEAGVPGQPHAGAYRAGLLLLAAGVAVLGRVVRVPLVAAGLPVSALLAGTSAVVPCTTGCPLPPYEPTTATDVVHASAGILGMALLAGAMVLMWLAPGPQTRVSRIVAAGAAVLTVPLGIAFGLNLLLAGRDLTGAVLERILLVVSVCWLVGTALVPDTVSRWNIAR
jgi:hypothetical protein